MEKAGYPIKNQKDDIESKINRSLKNLLVRYRKDNFPTIPALLIAIGIAGVFITLGLKPYIIAGREIINEIPEIEVYSDAGKLVVHSTFDPLSRTEYAYFILTNVNETAIIYVYWDTDVGFLVEWPAQQVQGVEAYIFDEENFTKYENDEPALYISYGALALVGQMYGITPHDGDYYVVFDNSKDQMKNVAYKEVNYNVRVIIPAHTERVKAESNGILLEDAIAYPFYGMILVGILGVVWWIFLLFRGKKLDEL